MALDDPKHQPREAARSGAVDGWLRAIARFALWRPWTLTLVGLALLVATAPAAVALYTDLRTDLRELLPRGAPAAVALEALEKRVGGFGLLAVMIETPDLKAGERFADAIGDRLTKRLVPTMAREVRWRTDDDMAYVHAHGALHVDLGDLEDLDLGLAAEIEARTARAAGFDLGLDDPPDGGARTSADAIDPRLDRVTKKLEARSKEQDHFLDGYLAGDDGHALAVLILPPEGTTSLDYDRRLRAAVDEELAAVPPKSFDPRIRIGYAGEVIDVIEAQEHLVQDLALSGVLVFVAVGGVIIGFYRSFRAIPAARAPAVGRDGRGLRGREGRHRLPEPEHGVPREHHPRQRDQRRHHLARALPGGSGGRGPPSTTRSPRRSRRRGAPRRPRAGPRP